MVEAACAGGNVQKTLADEEASRFTAATIQFHENTVSRARGVVLIVRRSRR